MQSVMFYRLGLVAGAAAISSAAWGEVVSLFPTQDTQVRSVLIGGETPPTYEQFAQASVLNSQTIGANAFVPYFQFDLTGLSIESINSATFSLYKTGGARNDTIVPGRFAVYGLPGETSFSPPNTPQNWVEGDAANSIQGLDFNTAGFEWTDNGSVAGGVDISRLVSLDPDDDLNGDGIFDDVNITEIMPATFNGYASITGPDLVTFLTDRLASTDNPGLVTFLAPIKAVNRGWGYFSKDYDADGDPLTDPLTDGSTDFWPTLTLDFVSSTVGGLAGDYNASGSVEQGDLDLVLNNWGGARTFEDGTGAFTTANVDQEELDRVLNNWGSSSAPSFAGVSVPEPAALALLAGLGGLALRRRVA